MVDWIGVSEISDGGFAILDGCEQPEVLALDQNPKIQSQSLFAGETQKAYGEFAPYLFECNSLLLDSIQSEFADQPWGLLLKANASFSDLRKHLGRRIFIKLPDDDDRVLFRFYDPRVFLTFAEAADPDELAEFLGPISSVAIPIDEDNFSVIENSQKTTFPKLFVLGVATKLVFDERQKKNQLDELVDYVFEQHPEKLEKKSKDDVKKFVGKRLKLSHEYHIYDEHSVKAFLDLSVCSKTFRNDKEEWPNWIEDILTYPNRASHIKVDLLAARLYHDGLLEIE